MHRQDKVENKLMINVRSCPVNVEIVWHSFQKRVDPFMTILDTVSGAGIVDAYGCGQRRLTVKDTESDVYMKQLIV